MFAYTCPCGATVLATETHQAVLPASLAMAVKTRRELPHVDDYLGISNHVSTEKQVVYEMLRRLGSVWSWECDECRGRLLALRKEQLESGMIRFELFPDLKRLVDAI